MIGTAEIVDDGAALRLRWAGGEDVRLPAIWLRDNAQDAVSRHPKNGQRLRTILDLPRSPRIAQASVTADGIELVFAPDGYRTRFAWHWLRSALAAKGAPEHRLWDCSLVMASATWPQLRDDDLALLHWLGAVARDGVARLDGVPCEDGALTTVIARFGYLRETNYGRWFDVRAEIEPINLAYTGLGLQVHTDNPYRDPVPGLQLLHCLANSAEGGDSIVVDGFMAASRLRTEAPEAFLRLTRTPVPFRYADAATVLEARAPLISLDVEGDLAEIRFNNRSLGTPRLAAAEMLSWYDAYRAFAELLDGRDLQVVFKLSPGQLFIVDNRRVLHGRVGYAGGGFRHLQGAYADRDGLLSTLAVLRRRYQEGEPA